MFSDLRMNEAGHRVHSNQSIAVRFQSIVGNTVLFSNNFNQMRYVLQRYDIFGGASEQECGY